MKSPATRPRRRQVPATLDDVRQAGQTEAGFTKAVLQAAKLYGWRCAHFRPSMNRRGKWSTAVQGDGVGWPDLFMVKGTRVIVAELKVGSRKLTREQSDWLLAFELAGIPAYLWVPADWKYIEAELRS